MGKSDREMTLELQVEEWKTKAGKYRAKWLRRAKELKREIRENEESQQEALDEMRESRKNLDAELKTLREARREWDLTKDKLTVAKNTEASLRREIEIGKQNLDQTLVRNAPVGVAQATNAWMNLERSRLDAIAGLFGVIDILLGQQERLKLAVPVNGDVDVKRLASSAMSAASAAKHPGGIDREFKALNECRTMAERILRDQLKSEYTLNKAATVWDVFDVLGTAVRLATKHAENRPRVIATLSEIYKLLTGDSKPQIDSSYERLAFDGGQDHVVDFVDAILGEVRARGLQPLKDAQEAPPGAITRGPRDQTDEERGVTMRMIATQTERVTALRYMRRECSTKDEKREVNKLLMETQVNLDKLYAQLGAAQFARPSDAWCIGFAQHEKLKSVLVEVDLLLSGAVERVETKRAVLDMDRIVSDVLTKARAIWAKTTGQDGIAGIPKGQEWSTGLLVEQKQDGSMQVLYPGEEVDIDSRIQISGFFASSMPCRTGWSIYVDGERLPDVIGARKEALTIGRAEVRRRNEAKKKVLVEPGIPIKLTKDQATGVDIGLQEGFSAVTVVERHPDGTDKLIASEIVSEETGGIEGAKLRARRVVEGLSTTSPMKPAEEKKRDA